MKCGHVRNSSGGVELFCYLFSMKFWFSFFLSAMLTLVGNAAEAWRTYTTDTGKSTLEAQLKEVVEDAKGQTLAVLRRKSDGVILKVPLARLSQADREYVASRRTLLVAPLLAGRWELSTRKALLQSAGLDENSEAAVTRSLSWLAKQQNANGSWGRNHPCAMTGFCLLAMAGHGETPQHPERGTAIRRGMNYLVETAQPSRQVHFAGIISAKPNQISSTYEHAIATQGLAEMLVTDQEAGPARLTLEKAVDRIIKSQNAKGMWGYKEGIGYNPSSEGKGDLSLSHWQVQALAMARLVLTNHKTLPASLNKAATGIAAHLNRGGGFGNPDRENHYNQWGLTGSSLWALRLIAPAPGRKEDASATEWLLAQEQAGSAGWNRDCYLYAWFFNAHVFHHSGGAGWAWWQQNRVPQILAEQLPEGNYRQEKSGEITAAGSPAAGRDAELYRTCLATLMLEVPYRYARK
jgi:hypothetical protein